jgi:hypothetical protein
VAAERFARVRETSCQGKMPGEKRPARQRELCRASVLSSVKV